MDAVASRVEYKGTKVWASAGGGMFRRKLARVNLDFLDAL